MEVVLNLLRGIYAADMAMNLVAMALYQLKVIHNSSGALDAG